MVPLILTIYCLLDGNILCAAPSISNITGTFSADNAVTIAGEGFGAKSTAAPLRYDNFENGTVGQLIPNNPTGGGWGATCPRYSQTQVRNAGSKSAMQEYINYWGCAFALDNTEAPGSLPSGITEMYVTGWFWMETGGSPSRNAKIINMGTVQGWQTRIDVYPENGSGHLYAMLSGNCFDTSSYAQNWNADVAAVMKADKQWHRIETYLKIGPNGYRDVWVDGKKIAEINGAFTGSSCEIGYLLIGHYFSLDTYTPAPWGRRYWDELYVDRTRARVEIGDASTFGACSHREIQIPTAWSNNSIAVKVNQGSFAVGNTAYLYVVDENGAVNSTGYPITIQSGVPAPSAPKGLRIVN